MIYVHSKLALADDEYALVSSANINNRSFSRDSEFGLLWQDPEGIKAMRTAFWGQLFGLPASDTLSMALGDWRRIANANVTTPPADRQGFVVPYQLARAGRFGRPAWFIPDDLV